MQERLTVSGQSLALLDVVHEEVLLFVDAGGEALGQGGFDGGVDGLLLLLGLGDGLLLLGAGLPPLLAP